MKKYAVIKLVAYAFTAVVLTAVLVFGILAGKGSKFAEELMGEFIDGGNYISAETEDVVLTDEVADIEIDWVSGSVSVVRSDDEKIYIHEEGDNGLSSEDVLVYRIDGDTLEIDFSKPKNGIFGVSMPSKRLTVKLPEKYYDEISIISVSADVDIRDISANSLNVEAVSGKTEITQTAFNSADIESVSGNAEIYLPADASFSLDLDTVSGNFNTDFAVKQQGDAYTAGNGTLDIDVESVSGNVGVYKK